MRQRVLRGSMAIGVVLLAGCSGEAHRPAPETFIVEQQVPLGEGSLVAAIRPGVGEEEIRRLTQETAGMSGVRWVEADYESRTLRVGLAEAVGDRDRASITHRLTSSPIVGKVDDGG